jgi:zinc transport system substrate-binding protein
MGIPFSALLCFLLTAPVTPQAVAKGPDLAGSDPPVEAAAGIPPIAFLVERIGGARVHVTTLLRPGDNPHTFELSPKQAVALGRVRLYVSVGFPFEQAILHKIETGRSGLAVVRAEQGILRTPAHAAAGHGHTDEASEDPHIWLVPALLRSQSLKVFEGLKKQDPHGETAFRQNLGRFLQSLDSLDRWIGATLAPFRDRAFLVFHPAFGRLADAYGLRQLSIEREGKSPSPRQVSECLALARTEGIRTVFVEPQFDPRSAQALARALGGKVETLDPLAPDVLANLRVVVGKLATSFARTARTRPGEEI